MDIIFGLFCIVLALVSLMQMCCSSSIVGPAEFCSLEEFTASCKDDEIILMESALYGRMAPGKCFPESEGNFGCYADVRHVVDSLCSGKQTCSVPVLHRGIVATKPCGSSMMGYLSTSYKCLKVANRDRLCTNGKISITERKGFLSPGSNCQIVLNVPSGRLINITVYNFMKSKTSSACYEIATLQSNKLSNVHLCPTDPRVKEVLVTSTSAVTIDMTKLDLGQLSGGYVLHFEATGCPQPTIPSDAHMERDGDRAKVMCNDSDNSWFIYCKNNKWTGHDRKCPEKAWTISKIFKTENASFPYGLFLTSFIGVGIGIFLGGFLLFLAINAFQRHQRRLRQAYEAPPVIPDPDYKIYDTSKMDFSLVPGFPTGGRCTIPRHQMSPPPLPSQPPEDERRFSRHTYEKPKYNSTDNSPFVDTQDI